VLAIGAMRYAFVVAGWALPWLRGQLPPRYWRKVVAAAQGIMLTVAASDLLPAPLTTLVAVAALAMLVESFGHDVLWLWHRRTVRYPYAEVSIRMSARPRVPSTAKKVSSAAS
jgi:hypothetical protein